MPEDEDDDKALDQEETPDPALQEEVKPDPDTEDEPPEESEDYSDLDYDQAQVILKDKFKGNVGELIKSWKSAQSLVGKSGQEKGEYRKLLAEAGYTWDVDGKPVPPKKPEPEVKAQAQQPRQEVTQEGFVKDTDRGVIVNPRDSSFFDPSKDYRREDGKWYHLWHDKYEVPIIPQEDWDNFRENDPESYTIERAKFEADRVNKVAKYNRSIEEKAAQVAPQERLALEQEINLEPILKDDPFITKAFQQAETGFKALPAEVRAQPGMYQAQFVLALASDLPAFIKGITDKARASIVTEMQSNPRIIATHGKSNGAAEKPATTVSKLDPIEAKWKAKVEVQIGKKMTDEEWNKYGD